MSAGERLNPRAPALRSSALVLVCANMLPLLGVFLWNWSVFEIVLLYWAENVFIGVINMFKMITASPDVSKMQGKLIGFAEKLAAEAETQEDGAATEMMETYAETIENHAGKIGAAHHVSKLFFVPFFCVHYGMFCFVHGIFVVVLLSGNGPFEQVGGFHGSPFDRLGEELFSGPLLLSALALGGSHLYSFFANFLGRGEFRRTSVPMLMVAPYGRIVVLHVAILFGAFAIAFLGSPVFLLVILIGGKTWLDMKLHLREHRKIATLPVAT